MAPINLCTDGSIGVTLLSNTFIDNYMKYANDVQIKIYIYLLRCMNAGMAMDISTLSDYFNYSEKDVLRALKYWEKNGILTLSYDTQRMASGDDYSASVGSLVGIHLSSLQEERGDRLHRVVCARMADISETPVLTEEEELPAVTNTPMAPDASACKASYTLDDMRAFKKDMAYGFLFTAAQQYLGRPLTEAQLRSLLFITKELHFSAELTDYLLQYCIGNGKNSFHYIETVALGWWEQGIDSVESAKASLHKEDDAVYTKIMGFFGRSGAPAPQEKRYMRRWLNTYDFQLDIIENACNRAVLAVETNRFAYADKILKDWAAKNVHDLKDIEALDQEFKEQKITAAVSKTSRAAAGQYCAIDNRGTDYDAIISSHSAKNTGSIK